MPNKTNVLEDRIPARSSEGVVITVYVESPSLSNKPHSNGSARRRRDGAPRARECFDRRAQLLAYTRDMRNGDATSGERLRSYADCSPKRKKRGPRWVAAQRKLRSWFDRMCRFRTWPKAKQGYERVNRSGDDGNGLRRGNKRGFPLPGKLKFNLRDLWWGCSRSHGS